MKVVVCGAGLLGITSAYVLASRGHEVEVIERNASPAMETSYANGGQLSYSHAEPWANPTALKKLPKWLLHEDSPLIFRLRADLPMFIWGLKFLLNCTESRARKNCVDMLRLGMYSRDKMAQIRAETNIDFDFKQAGILHIFSDERDLAQAVKQAEFQHNYGGDEKVISAGEALALEPTLAHSNKPLVGAILAHLDESGDPKKYCEALAAYAEKKLGVVFHYNTTIHQIRANNGKVEAISTDKGEFKGDAYVVALSSYSPLLLNKIGVRLPIYPMKGYSITVPASEYAPNVSITDGSHKIVFSRLGDRLRVAGTAEFAGYNDTILASRINPIVKAARNLFPNIDWETNRTEWACLRPSTPDGPPRIGRTEIDNLFVNTGHGTLGWTQAAGSAYVLVDIMEHKTPTIRMHGNTFQQ
jgi:D-amino-acid dehydrogenase